MIGMVAAMAVVVLAAVVVRLGYDTIYCYWVTPRRIRRVMESQGVRGPKPQPLTGNLLEMAGLISGATAKDMDSISHDTVPRLLPHYVAWSKQYGKRFMYWNGVEPRMCLSDPEMIRELLSKYSTLSGKSWLQQQGSRHFIGRGLLMANGHHWHHQRHILAPAFTADRLKRYAGVMVECTEEMVKRLERAMMEYSGAGAGGLMEFEMGDYMTQLTADIISRTEFGSSGCEKGKQIFQLLTKLQQRSAQATRHLCFPASRFLPTKYNREMKWLKGEVDRLLMEIIERRREGVEVGRISSSYGNNDLLGILLDQMGMGMGMGMGGRQDDLQLVMDELKTFFFAGHETTALLLTWTLMLLATNPHWQDRLRAQLQNVCNGATPSIHHLPHLTLLNMVIKESLRLYPPATVLPRMAFEDIRLGDLVIPKGLSIWVPVLAIHQSPDLWGPDAKHFNPERFANTNSSTSSSSFFRQYFIPFAAGPRNCIGQSFAMMEAKLILAILVSRFSFTISHTYRHAPVVVLTIKPKYGVHLYLKPIAGLSS